MNLAAIERSLEYNESVNMAENTRATIKELVGYIPALRGVLQTVVDGYVSPDADDQRGGYVAWCSWCDQSSYDGVAAIAHTKTCLPGRAAAVLAQATDKEGV